MLPQSPWVRTIIITVEKVTPTESRELMLEKLDISGTNITDVGFERILRHCPHLVELRASSLTITYVSSTGYAVLT